MKTILVPVEHNDLIESSLATACLLAKRFDSYLEGFALNPQVNVMMAPEAVGGVVLYPTDMLHQDQEAIAEESHRLFESAMSAHQMTRQTDPESNSGFAWNSRNPSGNDYLGGYGRVFDITVLGRPSTALTGPRMSTLEAALFETGRPILIAPPQAPERIGEVVTISWNGSTESARAIAFAMPILKRASRILVLTVEGMGVPGPTGEEVARHLKRNGIGSDTLTVKREGRSAGAAIIEEAAKIGSDLIVKGAFTQSRLRQMIFGGATSHLLAETTLPVLMAH